MSITCVVLYNEDGLHRQRLFFNTFNMYCHKICSTRYFSEIQRNVIYFQILFDDERVHFCPTRYVAN